MRHAVGLATVGVAALVLVAVFFAAISGMPLPAGDQDYFLPVASVYAETGALRHPFFSPIAGNRDNEMVWHGWLMPVLQGLAAGPGYETSLVPGVVLAAVLVMAWAALLGRAALVGVPILLALFLYQLGRPEQVASATLLLLAVAWRLRWGHIPVAGLAIGLTGIAAPVVGVAAGLVEAVRLAEAHGRIAALAPRVAAVAAIALAVAAGVTVQAGPVPLADWIAGLEAHAAMIAGRDDTAGLLHYALFQPRMPGVAVHLALLVLWLGTIWRDRGPGWWLAPAAALLGWVWFTALRLPPTIYNATALIPLVLVLVAQTRSPATRPLLLIGAVAGWIAIGLAGRDAVVGLRGGADPQALRAALATLPPGARVRTDSVAFAMIAREVLGPARVLHGAMPGEAAFRLIPQAYSGRPAPEVPPSACLRIATFHPVPLKDWAFGLTGPCD